MSYVKAHFDGMLMLYLLCCLFASSVHAQKSSLASSNASTAPSSVAFYTLPALQASTPIPGSTHVPGDFNGDGTSDVLWFNPLTSQLNYWTMTAVVPATEGGVTRTSISRNFDVTPGYFVGAVGDFDNDGYADLVFTSSNNDLWLWINNKNGGFTSSEIGTYPSNWQLVGAGDVDGDGYDDLLWVDAADCEFAYWTMHGAMRTGYRIVPVACGYYPVAVGYFTPTNRISIMWSSPAHDLYVWDSTATGFKSYDLTQYVNNQFINFAHSYSLGGGYMGSGIGIESYEQESTGTYGAAAGGFISRSFDDQGNQTSVTTQGAWSGGYFTPALSAGYLIQGNGVNLTALYLFPLYETVLSTGGLQTSDVFDTGNAPAMSEGQAMGSQWPYPIGWDVVGSPYNVMVTPPWQ